MSDEKYGFVYVWRDRKNKMFYVGCHWGLESDKYVCSSERMRSAYRRRPDDFKRRVVAGVFVSRLELLTEEHKWLSQIKDEELGKKFYNLNKHHFGHWTASPDSRKISQKIKDAPGRREKISAAHKGKKLTQEHRDKLRQAKLGKKLPEELVARRAESIRKAKATRPFSQKAREVLIERNKARIWTKEQRAEISARQLGKKRPPLSLETRRKISEKAKERHATHTQ